MPEGVTVGLREAYTVIRGWMDEGDLDRAQAVCGEVLQLYPADLQANRMLGELLYAKGDVQPAEHHFLRVLAADPEDALAHLGLAFVAEARGDLDAALQGYRTVLDIEPDMLPEEMRSRAEAELREPTPEALFRLSLATSEPGLALTRWSDLADASRGRPWVQSALLEALWRAGGVQDAAALAASILETQPEALKASLVLTWERWMAGDLDGAEDALEALNRCDSSGAYVQAHVYMAPKNWSFLAPGLEVRVELPRVDEVVAEPGEQVSSEQLEIESPVELMVATVAYEELESVAEEATLPDWYTTGYEDAPAPLEVDFPRTVLADEVETRIKARRDHDASALGIAARLEAEGRHAEAVDYYSQALKRGEAEPEDLLSRVSMLESHLRGQAAWHRLMGDLYKQTGASRRAMREYRLAVQARKRGI